MARGSGMSKNSISNTTLWRYGADAVMMTGEKNDWKCETCKSENDLTIHHKDRHGITEMRRGGEINNSVENLALLCRKCHGAEHTKDRKRTSGWKVVNRKGKKDGLFSNLRKDVVQTWNYETMRFDVETTKILV